jgi:hypothetical protein
VYKTVQPKKSRVRKNWLQKKRRTTAK